MQEYIGTVPGALEFLKKIRAGIQQMSQARQMFVFGPGKNTSITLAVLVFVLNPRMAR
jgi:hypothetical protein